MIGDMRQHVTQPSFGVDTVQLGRADQRVDRSCALPAAVGASKQAVTAPDRDATQARAAAELSIPMAPAEHLVGVDAVLATDASDRCSRFQR